MLTIPSSEPASGDVDACADRILEVVPRSMRRIRTEMRRQAPPRLTVPQMRALLFVRRHPATSLSALADQLGVSAAAGSVLIDRLVRQGLLERAVDPAERRRVCLTASTAGSALVAEAQAQTRTWLRAALGDLPGAELAALHRAMDVLDAVTARADEAAPTGARR